MATLGQKPTVESRWGRVGFDPVNDGSDAKLLGPGRARN